MKEAEPSQGGGMSSANPLTGGDAGNEPALEPLPDEPRLQTDGAAEEDDLVPCPFLFDDVDSMLTRADGGPTLLFHALVGSYLVTGAAFLAGTFFTPGLPDAIEARDPLLLIFVVVMFVSTGVMLPLQLVETRRTCHAAATGGLLPRLGAGTALITAEREQALRKLDATNGVHFDARTTLIVLPAVIFLGVFVATGWGLHSPAQNRVTAAILCFSPHGQLFAATATVTLKTATALIGSRVDAIIVTVAAEAATEGQDLVPEEWHRRVAAPCTQLVADLRLLTEGWATSLVLSVAGSVVVIVALLCVALSPYMAETLSEENTGLPWLSGLVRGLFFFSAVIVIPLDMLLAASAPAEVSTQCDALKETLNDVRINDLSAETDAKVAILERALANANRGQGVGFAVSGTVIDKRMLRMLGAKFFTGVSVIGPFILQFSVFEGQVLESQGTPPPEFGDAACALTATQAASIRAAMIGRNASCAFNMTVSSVIGI